MKTKAVRLYGEQDLRLEEFELPELKDGEILIKIVSDSVCMSTYKTAKQGAKHIRVPDNVAENPVIIGHEFCAEVVKVTDKHKDKFSVGDKVVLNLSRGVVTKLTATSTKGSATGTITSIIISAQSKLVMVVDSVEREYAIAMDAKYTIAGKEGSIYDLRLGNVVSVTLSGSTITKIEQATESTSSTKTGIVESISSSYGYVQIISAGSTGSVTEQIFASKTGSSISVKVINGETGIQMNFKDIKKNDSIIAVGAYSNGAFVAKTIIVTPN